MHGKSLYRHPVAIILLASIMIAAHVGILRLASMRQVTLALVGGVAAVLVLKYAWWQVRR
jgi:hypothetical protein